MLIQKMLSRFSRNSDIRKAKATRRKRLARPGLQLESLEHRMLLTGACVSPFNQIRVSDVSVVEGNEGSKTAYFALSVSNVCKSPITVNYSTADGSAKAGEDYGPVSGSVTLTSLDPRVARGSYCCR